MTRKIDALTLEIKEQSYLFFYSICHPRKSLDRPAVASLCNWLLFLCVCVLTQSYLTLCDPMSYSTPGCSVHGIIQARILDWVPMPSSRGVFPTQGWNLHLLHWQVASLPVTNWLLPLNLLWVLSLWVNWRKSHFVVDPHGNQPQLVLPLKLFLLPVERIWVYDARIWHEAFILGQGLSLLHQGWFCLVKNWGH